MSKLQLIIPTYGRVNKQTTFENLPPVLQARVAFIANKAEASELKAKYKSTGAEFVVHPASIDTIAKKRTWILKQERWNKLMMLDDDLKPYSRVGDGPSLKEATDDELCAAFNAISVKLDTLVHVGISPRQSNNRLPKGWVDNARMIYALGYQSSVVREVCILGRVEIREDMDLTLQLLRKGYPNAVYTDICFDQRNLYNAAGGAKASGRTIEQANKEAFLLQSLHPEYIAIVKRNYVKSTPRLEVMVQWQKAFQSSQRRGFF